MRSFQLWAFRYCVYEPCGLIVINNNNNNNDKINNNNIIILMMIDWNFDVTLLQVNIKLFYLWRPAYRGRRNEPFYLENATNLTLVFFMTI